MSGPVEALALRDTEPTQAISEGRAEPAASRSDRIAALVSAVKWHRITSSGDIEAIERLRYQCYLKEGAIAPNETCRLGDRFDEHPQTFVFGFSLQGKLIASIRVHVLDATSAASPTFMAFPDAITPLITSGHKVVDSSRFVIDSKASHDSPLLPYVVLRMPILLMAHALSKNDPHIQVDALAAVRTEHMPFYRRILRMKQIREPRPYHQLSKPLGLCHADCNQELPKVLAQNPSMAPQPYELASLSGEAGK